MALTVPKNTYTGLKELANLGDEEVERLEAALQVIPPAGGPRQLAADVASQFAELSSSKIRPIVRSLVTLYTGKALLEMDAADFSEEVCDGLREIEEFESIASEMSALRDRLERFLGLDGSLAITSKATGIRSAHEHLFVSARVLTDIRSVFGEDVTELPDGAVINHILALQYHDGAEHKEIFFALDSEGVEQLGEALDRARKKAKTLQSVLAKAEIPYLGGD